MQQRQKKKLEARAHLIEVAMALFEERGYANVTTEEIADRAEVSRRTLFRYFPNKSRLVFQDAELRIDQFRSTFAALIERETLVDSLRIAMVGVAEYYSDQERDIRLQKIINADEELSAQQHSLYYGMVGPLAEILERKFGGSAKAKRRARYLSGAIVGAMHAAMSLWETNATDLPLTQLASELTESLFQLDIEDIDYDNEKDNDDDKI